MAHCCMKLLKSCTRKAHLEKPHHVPFTFARYSASFPAYQKGSHVRIVALRSSSRLGQHRMRSRRFHVVHFEAGKIRTRQQYYVSCVEVGLDIVKGNRRPLLSMSS